MYKKGIPKVKFVSKVFRKLIALLAGVGSEEYDFCLQEGESKHRLERGEKVHG